MCRPASVSGSSRGFAKQVRLVAFGGSGLVLGQSGLTNGNVNDADVRALRVRGRPPARIMPPDGGNLSHGDDLPRALR